MAKRQWVRVSKREPCAVCERGDYCTRSADGLLAKCMRIESDRPASGELAGWIHRLADPLPKVEIRRDERVEETTVDWNAMALSMFTGAKNSRETLAGQLGVSAQSLERLGVGRGEQRGRWFWSFPERDIRGNVVGIVRRYDDGKKLSMKGGHSGLYFALDWWRDAGPLFLPEGGSDTAALLTMGLCAIGRPSNLGGTEKLIGILRHVGNRPVIVLGENDLKPERVGTVKQCPKDCRGCSWCWPGYYGARTTAERVGNGLGKTVHCRVVRGAKDVREWLSQNKVDGRAFLESLDVPKKWLGMLGAKWERQLAR